MLCLGGQVEIPSIRVLFKKFFYILVAPDVQKMPVIQTGALELLVINGKTERLDQMQNSSGHRTCARNVAGILVDLRLDHYNMKHKTPLYSYYFPYFM